jgi:hypothetical protein
MMANELRAGVRVEPVRLLNEVGQLLGLAVLNDVSADGLRLVASRLHPVGEVLKMTPEFPHALAGTVFPFRVTTCDPADGGGYDLVGSFLTPLSSREARALSC